MRRGIFATGRSLPLTTIFNSRRPGKCAEKPSSFGIVAACGRIQLLLDLTNSPQESSPLGKVAALQLNWPITRGLANTPQEAEIASVFFLSEEFCVCGFDCALSREYLPPRDLVQAGCLNRQAPAICGGFCLFLASGYDTIQLANSFAD